MQTLISLIGALSVPIVLLNMFGGLISGIWLAFLGYWKMIVIGIVSMIGSGMLISLALAPGLFLFATPGVHFIQRGNNILGGFFLLLNSAYLIVLMTFWSIFVLVYFTDRADESSLIPLLVWSYCVATTPWSWLAHKEQHSGEGNEFSAITCFLLEIAYVISAIMVLWGTTVLSVVLTFVTILGVGMLFLMSSAFASTRLIR